jgi:hypothetical protein
VSPVKYRLGFYIPEDTILHSYRRENFKCYNIENCCFFFFTSSIVRNSKSLENIRVRKLNLFQSSDEGRETPEDGNSWDS